MNSLATGKVDGELLFVVVVVILLLLLLLLIYSSLQGAE